MEIRLITPAMIKYKVESNMLDDLFMKTFNAQYGYNLAKNLEEWTVDIDKNHMKFRLFDNGIFVFINSVFLDEKTDYETVLIKKQEKTAELINRKGKLVEFLKSIESHIKTVYPKAGCSYFYNGKYVSYSLATYSINAENIDTAYSLALKRPVAKTDIKDIREHSLTVVNITNDTSILLIWGARVCILGSNSPEGLFETYFYNEVIAQYLWFLITAIDKRIDEYMLNEKGREANLALLLDNSYSVLYQKSKFDGVKNSKSHRYELEILNGIVSSSKIDNMFDNLEKKISLLKEKSALIEEDLTKKNRRYVNLLLGIVSFLSTISTIYAFVSVFVDKPQRTLYVIIIVVAVVLFGVAYLVQYLLKRKGKRNKKR